MSCGEATSHPYVLSRHRRREFIVNAIRPFKYKLSSKIRCFINLLAARFVDYRKWLDPAVATQTVSDKTLSAPTDQADW